MKFPFGIHEGEEVEAVVISDPDYLRAIIVEDHMRWLCSQYPPVYERVWEVLAATFPDEYCLHPTKTVLSGDVKKSIPEYRNSYAVLRIPVRAGIVYTSISSDHTDLGIYEKAARSLTYRELKKMEEVD